MNVPGFDFFWKNLESRIPEASIAMGLDRMNRALEALGHPERSCRVVLIAGTNGKGSTARFLEQLALQDGLRVGCFSSPHIFSPCERIRINGRDIEEAELVQLLTELQVQFPDATYFELFTLAALVYYQNQKVDLGIFEIGLGGRLDACNALSRVDAAAITSIGLDHMHLLGSSIAEIAREKVAVARPRKPLLVGNLPEEARREIEQYARQVGARVVQAKTPEIFIPAVPDYLNRNLALACAIAETLAISVPRDLGPIVAARPFGRWTQLSELPLKVVDGGHNPDGVAAALQAFSALKRSGREPCHVYLAVAGTKDLAGIVRAFNGFDGRIVAVAMEGVHWHSADQVAAVFQGVCEVSVLPHNEAVVAFAEAQVPSLWLGSLRALEIFGDLRQAG